MIHRQNLSYAYVLNKRLECSLEVALFSFDVLDKTLGSSQPWTLQADGPLDLRFNNEKGQTAWEFLMSAESEDSFQKELSGPGSEGMTTLYDQARTGDVTLKLKASLARKYFYSKKAILKPGPKCVRCGSSFPT